ncbi:phage tail protein [Brucella inopinata]|uniref:phage tail-collar fiber domain-containing protein n=1 Tax=Brucella inopinata TaxID=1218315 RepID=UPI0002EFB55A|nr:phage tail protein [Brucella inopinata]
MAQNYFSIVTNIGRNKLALSAAGGAAVTITHFAIGDGNGAEVNPTSASTALVREVWRTPVESVVIDPLNPSAVLVTSIIPTNAGGWWMREFGIFDVDGDMVAVAKPVSQYKPTALEGQLEDIRYEFQIIIGETANVTMLVDPSVLLASRDFVEKRKVPVAQLSLTPWVPVKAMTVTAPPANPTAWETYVIPNGATGAWAGQAQKLAEWNGQSWNIVIPPDGHGISLPDGRIFERINGAYVELAATTARRGLVRLAPDPYDFANSQDPITPADFRALSRGVGLDNLFLNSYFAWTNRYPTASRINFNWANNTYWPDRWKNVTGSAITATIDHATGGLALPNGAKIRQVVERANIAPGDIVISAQVAQGALSCTIEASGMAAATVPLDKTDAAGRKYATYTFPTVIGEDVSFTFLAIGDVRVSRTKLERGKKPSIWDPVSPDLELPRLDRYYQRHRSRETWTAHAAGEYFTLSIKPRSMMRIDPEMGWQFDTLTNAIEISAGLARTNGGQIIWRSAAVGSTIIEGEITLDADY